ncbi:MAG: hypothetical protein ABMA26_22165, partial [Limisphaerales bacterium]
GGFGFKDGKIQLSVSIGAAAGGLNFGGVGNTGTKVQLTAVQAKFEWAIGLPGNFSFSPTGKMSLFVGKLLIDVPNAINIQGTNLLLAYDPKGGASQELLRADSIFVTFPTIGLQGSVQSFNTGTEILPGLIVRGNGFALGQAEIAYGAKAPGATTTTGTGTGTTTGTGTGTGTTTGTGTGTGTTTGTTTGTGTGTTTASTTGMTTGTPTTPGAAVSVGGVLEFDDIRVGITDFAITFGSAIEFNGSIYFASSGARLNLGGAFKASLTKLRADLLFEDGRPEGLRFAAETMTLTFGNGFLVLGAKNFVIDTSAEGDEALAAFASVSADLKIGSLKVGGEARNFHITASGKFRAGLPTNPNAAFAVILKFGGDASSFKWPSFIPIQITAFGLQWADLENDPERFTILLSASVSSIKGIPNLQVSGTIDGIVIDPFLLLEGKFPIIGLGGIGVNISGDMFGGKVTAGLIGGMLRVGNVNGVSVMLDPLDTTTEVVDRVIFFGVEGGFTVSGTSGFLIRFALSELGPLGVFININVPVTVDPVYTQLTLSNFSAGVEFYKTLPSIDEPDDLRGPEFKVDGTMTADKWLASVKDQVFKQWKTLQNTPTPLGFFSAFLAPMVIKGSATIYTNYTTSTVFNGQVDVFISTDGKILLRGTLNFLSNQLSVSGTIYIDMSGIRQGRADVFVLLALPAQYKLFSVYGKMSIGYTNLEGETVEIPILGAPETADALSARAFLLNPDSDTPLDAGLLRLTKDEQGHSYLDILYAPASGYGLDYDSILDADEDFTAQILAAGGVVQTLKLTGKPIGIETLVTADGFVQQTAVTADSQAALVQKLTNKGIKHFRYAIETPGFTWPAGTLEVTFSGGWSQVKVLDNSIAPAESQIITATLTGATAAVATAESGQISRTELNSAGYLDIDFLPSGATGANTTTVPPPVLVLSGSGLGTAQLATGPPTKLSGSRYRYAFTGAFAVGEVTVTIAAGGFKDSVGIANLEQALTLTVTGASAGLEGVGSVVGITNLGTRGYLDVSFEGLDRADIAAATLTDDLPEFTVRMANGSLLTLSGVATQPAELQGSKTWRYAFTGTLVAGETQLALLAGSFIDVNGVTNAASTVTFTIAQPTAGLSNIVNGGFVQEDEFNKPEESTLFSGGTSRYFTFDLKTNVLGATVNGSSVAASDLSVRVARVHAQAFGSFVVNFETSTITILNHGFVANDEVTLTQTIGEANGVLANGGRYKVEVVNANELRLKTLGGTLVNLASLKDIGGVAYRMDKELEAKTGFSITEVRRVAETDSYQFVLAGEFDLLSSAHLWAVYLEMAEGAFVDSQGNRSGAVFQSIVITKPGINLFFEITGGVKLDSAGLDENAIFDVRGYVRFEAAIVNNPNGERGIRFGLLFGGTLELIGVGNVGSTAGALFLDTVKPVGPDPEALTVGELFTDLGLPINLGGDIAGITLPKIWGVMSLQTNLAFLKNMGIDLTVGATVQFSTLRIDKTETLRLEGIPGDILKLPSGALASIAWDEAFKEELTGSAPLFDGKLPAPVAQLFTQAGVTLGTKVKLTPIVFGLLWRVQDLDNKKQYFLEMSNITDFQTPDQVVRVLNLRGDVQEYVLTAKSFLIAGYGRFDFQFPPNSGNSLLTAQGAFAIKLTVKELSVFVNGEFRLGTEAQPLILARTQLLFVARLSFFNYAGKFNIAASLDLPGLKLSGSMQILFNTTFEEVNYVVPPFIQSAVGVNSIIIPAGAPRANGTTGPPAIYFALDVMGAVKVLDLFEFKGEFHFVLEAAELVIDLAHEVDFGLGKVVATGKLSISAEGPYGALQVALSVGSERLGSDFFRFGGQFRLELNGTESTQTIKTFQLDANGNVLGIVNGSISKKTYRFKVAGFLKIIEVIDFSGSFEIAFIDGGFLVAAAANVNILDVIKFRFDEEFRIAKLTIPTLVIDESVNADLDLGDWADFDVTFRLQINTGFEEAQNIPAQTFAVGMSGTARLFSFVHVQGAMQFTIGQEFRVNVATGLPAQLGNFLGNIIAPVLQAIAQLDDTTVSDDLLTMTNVSVRAMTLGFGDVKVFVGVGNPDMSKDLTKP